MGSEEHLFFGGGGMWLIWILLIVGAIFLFVSLDKENKRNTSSNNDSPLEILKKRYAQGEIDEDEFKRRRKELEK